MRWGGVVFLLVYGGLRFKAALAGGEALKPGDGAATSVSKVLTTVLVLTWANPHVYLDTVVLLGSISAQYPGHRLAFGVAAACGSFSFFTALGYGARLLAPVFANPKAGVVLEIIVGATMWAIALGLAFGG
jgi:L-lysine exporter family protein LysE/ArgO